MAEEPKTVSLIKDAFASIEVLWIESEPVATVPEKGERVTRQMEALC